jgi:hypothetical protein
MKRSTKGLLIAAVVCFLGGMIAISGLINVPSAATGVYVLLPTGAILFGLFLIAKGLEKETTRYDAEQQENQARAELTEEKERPTKPNRHRAHRQEESLARSH